MRPRRPPSPAWRAFWKHHVPELVALDVFTVPTIEFKGLFVLIGLAHERRTVLHVNVTAHPTVNGRPRSICSGTGMPRMARACSGVP